MGPTGATGPEGPAAMTVPRATLVDATGQVVPALPYIDSQGYVWSAYYEGSLTGATAIIIHEGTTCDGAKWLRFSPPLSNGLAFDNTTWVLNPVEPTTGALFVPYATVVATAPPTGSPFPASYFLLTFDPAKGYIAVCTPVTPGVPQSLDGAYQDSFVPLATALVVQNPPFRVQEPVHLEMR